MVLDDTHYWPEKMSADFIGYFLGFTKLLKSDEEIKLFWDYFEKTIFSKDVPSMFAGLYYIITTQENAPILSRQKEFLEHLFIRYLDINPVKGASLNTGSLLLLDYPTYDDTYDYRNVMRPQDRNFFLGYFGLT